VRKGRRRCRSGKGRCKKKKRQRGHLQASKGILREGEEEVQRAMRVGKEGLRGYMEGAVKVEEH